MVVLAVSVAAAVWLTATRANRAAWPPHALPRANVLLVTLDTVRADRIPGPSSLPITPTIARLMREGHAYTMAYSHAPLTLPAHASILTGLDPPAHGVRGNGSFRLDAAHVTLAERLSAVGYRTGAFVGAFVLDARFGLDQGFDRYDGVPDERPFAQDFAFAERRADAVLADAERWILGAPAGGAAEPWFAWAHLFDAHAPYDAPVALAPHPYDNEIAYADQQLGVFLERLRARGALDRTLIVVTADHGESLGDHGESTHGLFAYDSTLRVPLIVQAPGLGHGVHDALVTHSDIVPTVMEIVGLAPDPSLSGRSLRDVALNSASGRAAYLEAMEGWLTADAAPLTAIVADAWKYIEVPEPELYDLRADPGETRNRIATEPDRVGLMATQLRALGQTPRTPSLVPRDAEAEARLRSLGYVSVPPSATLGLGPKDDPKTVRPFYEKFLEILASPDRGRIDELLALVKARPSFIAARLTAASLLIEAGRAADAVTLLTEHAQAPAAPLIVRERLGAALLADGRAADAERLLADTVTEPEASPDAWNALGVARASLGEGAAAAAAFDRAVVLAPDSARYLFNRALSRIETGDAARGHEDLAALTSRHPDFADGWRALADVRYRGGDSAGAIEAWRRVVALAPSDLDTLFNLAVGLRDLGRIDEARRAADAFIAQASPEEYGREITALRGVKKLRTKN